MRRPASWSKTPTALERLEKVDTLVIDKTGTLTEGKAKVVEIVATNAGDTDEILRLAAGVERASEHPLAAAIVAAALERGIKPAEVSGFHAFPGKGVAGVVEGRNVALGNAASSPNMRLRLVRSKTMPTAGGATAPARFFSPSKDKPPASW